MDMYSKTKSCYTVFGKQIIISIRSRLHFKRLAINTSYKAVYTIAQIIKWLSGFAKI